MPDVARLRQAAADGRAATAGVDRQVADLGTQIVAERARLSQALATGDGAASEAARTRIGQLSAARRELVQSRARLDDDLAGDLAALLGDDIELEGDIPLVLLPVRIEVRSTADQAALRVRIFPDTVHVESLDEGLGDAELAAGRAYWQQVWPGGDTQGPWPTLVSAVGARRAPWVAESLRPLNLDERPGAEPAFPAPAPRGGNNAVARTLPDRFFVRVEQDGAAPVTVHGAAIPDELPVGLRDQSSLVELELDEFDLPPVDQSLKWLVDYAEAERLGMAVTVPLPVAGRAVRRLVVYGVRAALAPAEGAARLARLIRSHGFTDGAEFVAQGTPTNNTDSARTGWSRRTPAGPPELAGAGTAVEASNAGVVATALGIDPAQLGSLQGAGDGEQARAAAFNAALWTTTWKEAVEHISQAGRNNGDKRLDSPSLDAVRDFWIESVRGRGPLPAIRLGRQPYGLLPLVSTDASWRPVLGGFIEERLVPFLDGSVRRFWNTAQSAVATIANRPLDTCLPEILGTDAVLRSLRVRSALPPDPTMTTAEAWVLPDLGQHTAQQQVAATLNLVAGVDWGEADSQGLLGKKTRTLALPLVDETDSEYITNLLAPVPRHMAPASVLQVLLAHAAEVERDDRGRLVSPEHSPLVREAINGMQVEADRGLLAGAFDAIQAQSFDDRQVAAAAAAVTKQVGRLDKRAVADRHPIPALAPATMLERVAGEEPSVGGLRSTVGTQLIGEIFHAGLWAGRFRSALETIAAIDSLEERRLLLSETLDCCSHRLDAWITGAAAGRLRGLRQRSPAGAFVGAYGWLEDIELRTPAAAGQVDGKDVLHDGTDGGFIHTPGLNHAATAGVMRSGRLTHRRGDPNNEALDIDLSCARVRDALSLLEGMRRGQPLGALLGYRLERQLHDQSGNGLELDRFIYVLRTLAPLRAGKLTAPGQPVEEGLAARDVVDGLRLMELDWAVILAKLVSGPDDPRYIVPPDTWTAPRPANPAAGVPGEADAVKAAIDKLQRTHDAVADLLLTESVHQLVVGNPARAAAAMDVLGAGESVPPDPDVVRTPRNGITLSHRIAILIADPPPEALPGWNADAPRARAEPRLEAWAQGVLGDPAAIRIASDHLETLAGSGLSALDVLYDADGDSVAASTLAARLRLRFGLIDKELPLLAPVWELAAMLRARLAVGRVLDVADLGFPGAEAEPRREPKAAELLDRATTAAQELEGAAAIGSLEGLVPYGLRPPAPSPTLDLTGGEHAMALSRMVEEALRRVGAARQLLSRAAPPTTPAAVAELSRQALGEVFGAGFLTLPVLGEAPKPEVDPWAQAIGPAGVTARPGVDIRPWLMRAGVLRPAASMYGETLLVREAQGRTVSLRVVQTPAGAYGTWAALPFPEGKPPKEPLRGMVAEVAGGPDVDLSGSIAGVVLDEWVDTLPKRLEVGDPAKAPTELVDVTTTGIALNANAPGSRPPQAIMLALSADGAAWNGDRLVHVLEEALALAKLRCVTLDQLPYVGRYLPALYFRDWSLQGEPVIDWLTVSEVFQAAAIAPYLKVDQ
jgi:hypothetical protein